MQEERAKQIKAEIAASEEMKAKSLKSIDFLKLQVKAEDQKIKANLTLLDAISANAEQKKGE